MTQAKNTSILNGAFWKLVAGAVAGLMMTSVGLVGWMVNARLDAIAASVKANHDAINAAVLAYSSQVAEARLYTVETIDRIIGVRVPSPEVRMRLDRLERDLEDLRNRKPAAAG